MPKGIYKRTKKELERLINLKEKKDINEKAFDKIDENNAYWLGFLASDGTICKRGNSYQITIG